MIAGPSAGTNSAPVTLKRYQTLETGVRTTRANSYTNEVPRVRESACASSLVIPMREDSPMEDIRALYAELTDGLTRPVRAEELVYAAPGLPSRDDIDAEREKLQKNKTGLEIAQGKFLGDVLADKKCGRHLIDSMLRPTPLALD